MRAELLAAVLRELQATTADIEASAVLSIDGLVMASVLPPGAEAHAEDRIGAMSAAMLALGERTARELARGELEQVMVRGQAGLALITRVGAEAVLTVLCKPQVRLGLVLLDIKRTADHLERVL